MFFIGLNATPARILRAPLEGLAQEGRAEWEPDARQ